MPRNPILVGAEHDLNSMKNNIVLLMIVGCLLQSCDVEKRIDLKSQNVEDYLSEMALIYWDFYYSFPQSYQQSRDTDAWFFPQYTFMDSLLLCHAQELVYTNQDTALLITYRNDTIALVQLPCSCEWTDEIPLGPRAYDSLGRMILDELIPIGRDAMGDIKEQVRLTYEIVNNLFPDIEKRMNKKGFVRADSKRQYPQYLLIEYSIEMDSIQLIKACHKYSCYFYDEYAEILRTVFYEYCNYNHVSKLLTPIEIYIKI